MNANNRSSEAALLSRIEPIDAFRGLIIILMALDHANYFIAQRHPSGEHWGGPFPSYDDPIAFLTRFVTHLSAPGFFFLMGMGMMLFAERRAGRGWPRQKIRRHLALRGLILIVLQFVIVNPIWKISPIPFPDWYQGVLVALGAT
ncbi:MAG: heparan-alpha-glucosaminide N-acetyltransferase domain-containing protein, partial [Anaerolineales bacterium]